MAWRGAQRVFGVAAALCGVVPFGCHRTRSGSPPAILLFAGKGVSSGDVAAIERLLTGATLPYDTADSSELDRMSEAELAQYRLLIVPGGNFEELGHGLAANTPARVRLAVQHGLNYFGICAGAFWAGDSPYNGLNLTQGVRFPFSSLERQGLRKASVPIVSASSVTLEQYWEDGPALSGWGDAVAKYPDGAPAVVEGRVGEGWVILSGVHPEAPESWRRHLEFSTTVADDNAYALRLVEAALNRSVLPHY